MRRLRRFLSSEIYFVTIRTVEERFALEPYAYPNAWADGDFKPLNFEAKRANIALGRACVKVTEALTEAIARSEQDATQSRPEVPYKTFTDSIPNIIGSCMARGIKMFGVHLYGFVWMSNHGHLLLRAPKDNFAEFMAYLNGQIAVNVNRFLGRKHQLWARRYAAAQVLDEAAELEMLGYLLANPQNAGLVNSIDEWPGLSSAAFFFRNREQRFLCFDRTAWYKEQRPDDIAPYLSTVVLEHKLLPQLSRLDEKKLRRKLRRLIKRKVKLSPLEDSKVDRDPMLPIRRRLLTRAVIPTDRPESSKNNTQRRSPQPLCHTTKPSFEELYKKWYHTFREKHADCSREYRQGKVAVEFPPGSFAPSKYPPAQYAKDPDAEITLHPTRRNIEIEAARRRR
jgi:REP element-mobilizing transposase RayT